jgi:hypothetical protein
MALAREVRMGPPADGTCRAQRSAAGVVPAGCRGWACFHLATQGITQPADGRHEERGEPAGWCGHAAAGVDRDTNGPAAKTDG